MWITGKTSNSLVKTGWLRAPTSSLMPTTRWRPLHIPVENEHLFRFKMNADSGLRVHRFRTPQCTYSDVRWTVLFQRLGSTTAALRLAAGLFSESKRCLPSKLSFCSKNPCPHTFRKWCSQIPESLFNFTGIRNTSRVSKRVVTNYRYGYDRCLHISTPKSPLNAPKMGPKRPRTASTARSPFITQSYE